jgi:ubiquitin-conjugating enzyme E2 W
MNNSLSIRHLTPIVALYLLVVLLFVEGTTAGLSTSSHSSRTLKIRTNRYESLERVNPEAAALYHRSRQIGGGFIFGRAKAYYRHKKLSSKSHAINTQECLDSVLSIRGGASSSSTNNAVQSILKSILASSAIPSPIKKLIEMVCHFIESLTGLKVLPRVRGKKKSKSNKSKETVLLREAMAVGTKKKFRSKRNDDGMLDTVLLENIAWERQSKNRKSKTTTDDDTTTSVAGVTITSTKPDIVSTTNKSFNPKHHDAASKKFLSNNLKSSNPNYRIQRELKEFLSSPPPGLTVKISGKNVRLWIITLSMPENTIYAGETYKLRVQFPNDYPTFPPSVYFLPPTPRHEHVYTNGDICLSLLGTDWRPIMTAQSIAQAIMSILCGAQRKSLPMDNARHAGNKPGLKQEDWVYHDDNC